MNDASHRCTTHRDAAHRIATRRNSTQRNVSFRRNAPPLSASHRAAPLRASSQLIATQRNVFHFLKSDVKMLYQTSAETLRLRAFLAEQLPGTRLSYRDIEAKTGVTMNDSGRDKLRRAAAHEGLPYDCVIGWGIELANATNGTRIVGGRLERVRRAVVRCEKTHEQIVTRFLDKMSEEDQQRCVYIGVVFAAMHAAANRVRNLQTGRVVRKLENT